MYRNAPNKVGADQPSCEKSCSEKRMVDYGPKPRNYYNGFIFFQNKEDLNEDLKIYYVVNFTFISYS